MNKNRRKRIEAVIDTIVGAADDLDAIKDEEQEDSTTCLRTSNTQSVGKRFRNMWTTLTMRLAIYKT